MSLAAAHRFIAATRKDAALRAQIAALGSDPAMDQIVGIATAAGFAIDADSLRAAYRQDWALRGLAAVGG